MATLKIQKTGHGFTVSSTIVGVGKSAKALSCIDNMSFEQAQAFVENPKRVQEKKWYKDLLKEMSDRIKTSEDKTKKAVDRLHAEQKVIDDAAAAEEKALKDKADALKDAEKKKLAAAEDVKKEAKKELIALINTALEMKLGTKEDLIKMDKATLEDLISKNATVIKNPEDPKKEPKKDDVAATSD